MYICQQEAIVRSGVLLAIVTSKNENVVCFRTVSKQSMDDILGHLPPELLNNMLSCFLPQHIKNLRLVSRKYHDASSHLLMKRAFFALRPATLAVFNKIVEHPIFRRSVTEIVYDTSYFIDQRQRRLEDPCYFSRCLPYQKSYSQEVVDAADHEYRRLFFQQERIRGGSEDTNALRRASQMLVNLSSIVYTDWVILNGSVQDSESRHGKLIIDFKELGCWYLREGPMSWDVKDGCLPAATQVYCAGKISPMLSTMCGHDSNWPRLRGLTFTIHDSIKSLIRLRQHLPLPEETEYCANLMRNLNTINISTGTSIPHFRFLRGISKLLSLAKQLRSLKLKSSTCPNSYTPSKEWELLFPNSWPQLQSLDLSGFWHVNINDLLGFLRRHSSTVKNLALSGLYIVEESENSWVDFALQLQTALPRLHSLDLRKLSEAGDNDLEHLINPDGGSISLFFGFDPRTLVDCPFRCKHLRLLEQWVLTAHRLPIVEQMELRQRVEDLRGPKGWHDCSQMDLHRHRGG